MENYYMHIIHMYIIQAYHIQYNHIIYYLKNVYKGTGALTHK